MSSSTVTYTSVYSDSEPWRFQWVSDDELEAPEEAPQPLEQAPPSPDYVPGPEHPPLPDYILGSEYPEYLVPTDDEAPIKDQPLPADASPISLSLGYVADSDPLEEDPKKDPKEDPAEYPVDGGDDDEEEEEAFEEDEEEEEHLAPADSTTLPVVDLVPLAEDTETPMPVATEALIVAVAAALPSSPPPSPLTPLSSLLPQIPSPPLLLPSPPTHSSPTYAEAPSGYRAAMIQSSAASPLPLPAPSSPLLLPATDRREDVPKADVPPQKRLCLTAPAPRFKVRESLAAAAAR
ncbi:hypothetical protein Tco_1498381 [Tanacetum coccineum]